MNTKVQSLINKVHTVCKGSPLLGHLLAHGTLRRPTFKRARKIVGDLLSDELLNVEIGRCATVLNELAQSPAIVGDALGSIRGFFSGTLMLSVRGSSLGAEIAKIMEMGVADAVNQLRTKGEASLCWSFDDRGGAKLDYRITRRVLKEMGVQIPKGCSVDELALLYADTARNCKARIEAKAAKPEPVAKAA